MIKLSEGLWHTDPTETMCLYEYFVSTDGMEYTQKPMCQDSGSDAGCGKVTCYMVFPNNLYHKKKNWVVGLTGLRMHVKDDKCYFPIQECGDCHAKLAGYNCGRKYPQHKHLELDRIGNHTTPEESERLKALFSAAYSKARDKAITAAGEKAKSADRYKMVRSKNA